MSFYIYIAYGIIAFIVILVLIIYLVINLTSEAPQPVWVYTQEQMTNTEMVDTAEVEKPQRWDSRYTIQPEDYGDSGYVKIPGTDTLISIDDVYRVCGDWSSWYGSNDEPVSTETDEESYRRRQEEEEEERKKQENLYDDDDDDDNKSALLDFVSYFINI